MPADIINLRQARKRKARRGAERRAEENRARFGRDKAQRAEDDFTRRRAGQDLDGKKLDPDGDETPD